MLMVQRRHRGVTYDRLATIFGHLAQGEVRVGRGFQKRSKIRGACGCRTCPPRRVSCVGSRRHICQTCTLLSTRKANHGFLFLRVPTLGKLSKIASCLSWGFRHERDFPKSCLSLSSSTDHGAWRRRWQRHGRQGQIQRHVVSAMGLSVILAYRASFVIAVLLAGRSRGPELVACI